MVSIVLNTIYIVFQRQHKMKNRKPAKEVLSEYSSQQLTETLIEELEAVGIKYTIDPNGHASQFIPLSTEDTKI